MTEGPLAAPFSRIRWGRSVRLIASRFPPIEVFEDIADPADWEHLKRAEMATNPRLADTMGDLDKVPVARRVSGPGASLVMAPFVHASPDYPGRFHDGTFGAYYAAKDFETAVAEKVFHAARFARATAEAPGWLGDWRELVGRIDATLADVRGEGFAALLGDDVSDYAAPQAFARAVREAFADGIVYPSVRNPGGECFAAFWPDVMAVPKQARHFAYHWDGERVDFLREVTLTGDGAVFRIVAGD